MKYSDGLIKLKQMSNKELRLLVQSKSIDSIAEDLDLPKSKINFEINSRKLFQVRKVEVDKISLAEEKAMFSTHEDDYGKNNQWMDSTERAFWSKIKKRNCK